MVESLPTILNWFGIINSEVKKITLKELGKLCNKYCTDTTHFLIFLKTCILKLGIERFNDVTLGFLDRHGKKMVILREATSTTVQLFYDIYLHIMLKNC